MASSEACCLEFSLGTPVLSLLQQLIFSADEIKTKDKGISTQLTVELSLRTSFDMLFTHDRLWMCST